MPSASNPTSRVRFGFYGSGVSVCMGLTGEYYLSVHTSRKDGVQVQALDSGQLFGVRFITIHSFVLHIYILYDSYQSSICPANSDIYPIRFLQSSICPDNDNDVVAKTGRICLLVWHIFSNFLGSSQRAFTSMQCYPKR